MAAYTGAVAVQLRFAHARTRALFKAARFLSSAATRLHGASVTASTREFRESSGDVSRERRVFPLCPLRRGKRGAWPALPAPGAPGDQGCSHHGRGGGGGDIDRRGKGAGKKCNLHQPTWMPAAPSSSALRAALRQATAVGLFWRMRRHHLAVSPSSCARGTCGRRGRRRERERERDREREIERESHSVVQ